MLKISQRASSPLLGVARIANNLAQRYSNKYLMTTHFLIAMAKVHNCAAHTILNHLGVTQSVLLYKRTLMSMYNTSDDMGQALRHADQIRTDKGDKFLQTDHLLIAIAEQEGSCGKELLNQIGVDIQSIKNAYKSLEHVRE